MAKYAPLRFIDHIDDLINRGHKEGAETILDVIKRYAGNETELTDDDILKVTSHGHFMHAAYEEKGGYKHELMNILRKPEVIETLATYGEFDIDDITKNQDQEKFNELLSMIRQSLVKIPILNKWAANKQVYKLDYDFTHLLLETDKLVVYKDILEHLPFDTFYIDLSLSEIPNLEGIFVNVTNYNSWCGVYAMQITSQMSEFTSSYMFNFSEGNDSANINIGDMIPNSIDTFAKHVREVELYNGNEDAANTNYNNIIALDSNIMMLILQFLMYLGTEAPDIEESAVSKSTYNPGSTIKNSFKEVRTWDVGVHYGTAFRVAAKEFKKECNESVTVHSIKASSSKRPHMRKAHWHRYHTGKGRTGTILKWLPPIFVLGSGKEIPVTIHEVV